MSPLLIMMVGLPGSGKTTLAEELHRLMATAGRECEILSSDSHIERVAVSQGKSYQDVFQEHISQATELMWRDAKCAKRRQVSVIWDRANLQRRARAGALKFFANPYRRIAAVMPVTETEAVLRNGKRTAGRAVPFDQMRRMICQFVGPQLNEGFDLVLDKEHLLGESAGSFHAVAERYWEEMGVLL